MFNLFGRKNLLTFLCTFFVTSNPLFAQLKPTGTLGEDLFVSNSIVKLLTPFGTGSGVVVGRIKDKSIIITARHVIEGTANGEKVEVYHSDGNIVGYVDNRDIKKSDIYDLAVLFVKNKKGRCLISVSAVVPVIFLIILSYFLSLGIFGGFISHLIFTMEHI